METSNISTALSRATIILEGDAKHVRLASLLQLAEIEMYTARLTLGEVGFISVRNGAVIAARAGGLDGVDAIYEMFLHLDGRVRVELDDGIEGRPLAATIAIVMDGCRLVDEWAQLEKERWTIAHAVQVDDTLGSLLTRMRPLIMAMERGARLEAALVEVGMARVHAVGPLCTLVEAGVIVPAKARPLTLVVNNAPEVAPVEMDPAMDIDDLITHARRLARANDFDRAERMLKAALERRPNDRVIAQNLRHLALRRVTAA